MTKYRWLVVSALALALLIPGSALAERNRLVFMSDLHMNQNAPYSWLRDNIQAVADFLDYVNDRIDVAELIILGDLVDKWIYPQSQTPEAGFGTVLNDDVNREIKRALKAVCGNPLIKVTYVSGNHDMLAYESQNLAVLAELFPGMEVVASASNDNHYAKDNLIWAEHGHRYCLFNAMDIWSRDGGHLPLGYFISRALADKSASDGEMIHYPDILAQSINEHGVSDLLPEVVYEAIALYSGHTDDDPVVMNGLDAFTADPTVGQVRQTYREIYTEWSNRQNIIANLTAVVDDMGTLVAAATHQFLLATNLPFTPRIMVMGHTHKAAFHHFLIGNDVYVNTGTWIDGKTPSYAEIAIEDKGDHSDYTVELWFWGEAEPYSSATVVGPVRQVNDIRPGG